METINKISDEEIEVTREITTRLDKSDLLMRKSFIEKQLADLNDKLKLFE